MNKTCVYYCEGKDVYFNRLTVDKLDEHAMAVVAVIDESELVDIYTMKSRFDNTLLNTDKLSSGCKTVLKIMYNPDKVFDLRGCGENALKGYPVEENVI